MGRARENNLLTYYFLLGSALSSFYCNFITEASSYTGGGKISSVFLEDGLDLNDRFYKIEAHNRNQDKDISLLKTTLDEERKISQDLRNRFILLENLLVNILIDDKNNHFQRVKRPARLLPLQLL